MIEKKEIVVVANFFSAITLHYFGENVLMVQLGCWLALVWKADIYEWSSDGSWEEVIKKLFLVIC